MALVLIAAVLAPIRGTTFGSPVSAACYGYACGPPTVTNVSPNTGSVAGGTSVTITGTFFSGDSATVSFGGVAATGVVVVDDSHITANSPAHVAGTVDVRVTTSSGTSAISTADQFTYLMGPCTSVTTSAAPPSPQMVGTGVVVKAVASGCPNPRYEFWLLAPGASLYVKVQAYSPTATYNWTTTGLAPGTYRFNVHVQDAASAGTYSNAYGTWDAYDASLYFTLTAGCSSVTTSAAPPSPHMIGATIVITAVASGCPNPRYEFWLLAPGATLYVKVQAYSPTATYNWNTTGLAPGTYRFNVHVQDAASAGTNSNAYGTWDAYDASLYYTLTVGCPAVTTSAAPPSPQMVGNAIVVTASAPGCPNPRYEFWLLAPGASLYVKVQAYSPTATYNWSTTGLAPGTYRFNVHVQDASSAGTSSNAYGTWDAYDASLYYTLTAGCPSVTTSAAPPSPHAAGTAVVVTATASGCPNPRYEFWVLAPGASLYVKVQSYSPSGTYNWSTTGLAPGTYRFNVHVQDASSAGTFSNAYGTWDTYDASLYYTIT